MGLGLKYFWHKNEKIISLNFISVFYLYVFDTHAPAFFIIKICFTNKVNTICGGGELLVTWFQGPITWSQVSGSHIPGLQVPRSRIPVPGSHVPKVPGPRVSDLRIPGLRSQGFGSWVSGPDFRLCHEKSPVNY